MPNLREIVISELEPGMALDDEILDQHGRTLVQPGTKMTPFIINNLTKRGIETVYIRVPDDPTGRGQTAYDMTPRALEAVREYRAPDPPKVKLEQNVRLRILENVQNLYQVSDPEEIMTITEDITDDLMSAISKNESLLVHVNDLKVSDEYTFKHCVDVAVLAMTTGRKMGLNSFQVHELGNSGLLHDLGKQKIPDEILNKPAKLTDEEFEVIKKHSEYGYEMVCKNPDVSSAVAMGVLQHHEKINGTGYPKGLKGDEISLYGKILAIVDIYDALVTARPYKEAKTQRVAIEMLMSMTSQLDIDIMNAFFSTMLLYPVDSFVKLSNSEYARVVRQNKTSVLRPTVVGVRSGTVYKLDRPEFQSIVIV